MDSIPRKPKYSNRTLTNTHTQGNTALHFEVAPDPAIDSELLEIAKNYSAMGWNTFPIPYKEKGFKSVKWGMQWRKVTRSFNAWHIYQDDAYHAFKGFCNIAVATGHTSKGYVIDIDDPELADRAIYQCIEQFGHIFAVQTRRGVHIYFHTTDNSIPSQKFDGHNIEIKGDGCYVVGLGSIFRDTDGREYNYTAHSRNTGTPTLTPDQLAEFIYSLDNRITLKRKNDRHYHKKQRSNRYDATTQDYLDNGHSYPEGTRHDGYVNACRSMLAYGDDPDYVYNTLYPIAVASGHKHNEVHSALQSTIDSFDPSKMSGGKLHVKDTDLSLAKELLSSYHWSKPYNETTRAVLKACIEMAKREYGKPKFRVASREIAELAHVSRNTASRHLHLLATETITRKIRRQPKQTEIQTETEEIEPLGILTLSIDPATGTQYAQWNREKLTELTRLRLVTHPNGMRGYRFVDIDAKSVENGTVVRSTILEVNTVTQSTKKMLKLLQERTALGHKTLQLWLWLHKQSKALNMRDIAEKTGLTYQSARHQVKKLIGLKLVEKQGKLYGATVNDIEILNMLENARQSEQKRIECHEKEQLQDRVRLIINARRRNDIYYPGHIKKQPKQPEIQTDMALSTHITDMPENVEHIADMQYERELFSQLQADFHDDILIE